MAFNLQTSEVVSLALSLVGLLLTLISKKSIKRFSQVKITHYSIIWLIPWFAVILFLMLLMKKVEVYLVIILFSFIYYVLHNRNNGEVGCLKKTLVNGCFLTIKVWPLLIIVGLISSNLLGEFKPQQNVLDLKIGNYTKPMVIPGGFILIKLNDVRKDKKKIDIDEEFKKVVKIKTGQQLNTLSNIYFKKILKNYKIENL